MLKRRRTKRSFRSKLRPSREEQLGSDQESLNKAIRETVSGLSDDDLSEMLSAPAPQYTAFARQVAEEELANRKQARSTHNSIASDPKMVPRSLREQSNREQRAGCYIDVWSDNNFEGEHLRIDGPVEHQTLDLKKVDWCNSISSLRVGPTAFVLVYSEQDFSGAMKSFGPGDAVPDLKQLNFNDEIDSIRLVNSMKVFDGVHVEDASSSSGDPSQRKVNRDLKPKKRGRRNH
jgi:hypothetical protein